MVKEKSRKNKANNSQCLAGLEMSPLADRTLGRWGPLTMTFRVDVDNDCPYWLFDQGGTTPVMRA